MGGTPAPPPFLWAKLFFFLSKIGVDERERVVEKMRKKNDIRVEGMQPKK